MLRRRSTTLTCRSSKAATSSFNSTSPDLRLGPVAVDPPVATRGRALLPRPSSLETCLSRCLTRTSMTSSATFATLWMSVSPSTGGLANREASRTRTSSTLPVPLKRKRCCRPRSSTEGSCVSTSASRRAQTRETSVRTLVRRNRLEDMSGRIARVAVRDDIPGSSAVSLVMCRRLELHVS